MNEYTLNIEANPSDVYVLAGPNTDPATIDSAVAQASALIESLSGVVLYAGDRTTPISTADAVWVRKAIVLQAAWMVEQPDVFSRQSVSNLSQDGISVSAPNELTFVLAPLAKRALNNCSWAKNGTLKIAPATTSRQDVALISSDNHAWEYMGAI